MTRQFVNGTMRDELHAPARQRAAVHRPIATLEDATDTRRGVTDGSAFIRGVLATR